MEHSTHTDQSGIDIHSIEVFSSTHVEIRYSIDGESCTLDLEYDDAGDLLEAIAMNPFESAAYARQAIEAQE